MPNPYQSPVVQAEEQTQPATQYLTRGRVLGAGLGSIIAAIVMVVGRHALFMETLVTNGQWSLLVLIVDCVAGVTLLVGLICIALYHWFPDPRRKYSWRRKQPSRNFDLD